MLFPSSFTLIRAQDGLLSERHSLLYSFKLKRSRDPDSSTLPAVHSLCVEVHYSLKYDPFSLAKYQHSSE